ncbi:MAG: hypothetical protein A3K30_03665 [Deltaproteobacteria bacterium RBG_13_51_10]|nr:MAG: hypothetical protein A3K30_03665 [Deltaproteobacteria bacterium RBG_13_51_10]
MAKIPKKVVVIGLDAAQPVRIDKYAREGTLPNINTLIEGGVFAENCLVPYPTVTPPNWTTIVTGTWPGTHGITDFHVHRPGDPLDKVHQGFTTEDCQAEYIWEAIEKAGRKSIVFNYPCSWPPRLKKGIVVGGAGLTPNEWRAGDDLLFINSKVGFCSEQMISTRPLPLSRRVEFGEAEGWKNAPPSPGEGDLEAEFRLRIGSGKYTVDPIIWYLLVQDSAGKGYDRVTLSPSKNFQEAFFTLSLGEWSKKIYAPIKLASGAVKEVHFRGKLVELTDDADGFRLYLSALGIEDDDYCYPPEISKEIRSEEGLMAFNGGYIAYSLNLIDMDTYMEVNHFHNIWLADVATHLLTQNPWDLFTMHFHAPDWFYHAAMTDLDSLTQKDEKKRESALNAERRMYQSLDKMIGRIMEAAGKDTLMMLVSDHGAMADGPAFNPFEALVPAGLAVLKEPKKESEGRELLADHSRYAVDWEKTKAVPQRDIHIYINLKGRDPQGIVEPGDYEKVQRQIIDALYDYKDPRSGKRVVALALTKKDARILGLWGDRVGDVVYALNPEYGAQHGQQLPAAELGQGNQRSIMIVYGPGIKKGYRLKRTMWLTDIVPTICHLMNWPMPKDVEGAVIYQMFRDPNFKQNQVEDLQKSLESMEKALARGERNPWDKHDCA